MYNWFIRRSHQDFFSALLDQLIDTTKEPVVVKVGVDTMKPLIKVVAISTTLW
jgi:hypothetical protein